MKNRYCPTSRLGFKFGHTEVKCLEEIGALLWNLFEV
jgi:hypothetical protein